MDPFLGEIRMFAGPYAPVNWHFCDGALLPIGTYQALYALLGTAWGGDGATTFGLPDLRGRLPVGQGAGTGLTARTLGQTGGASQVTLTIANFPAHTHAVNASNAAGTSMVPTANGGLSACVAPPSGKVVRYAPPTANPAPVPQSLADATISYAAYGQGGGVVSHDNLMPYQAVNYIICLQGMFPERP